MKRRLILSCLAAALVMSLPLASLPGKYQALHAEPALTLHPFAKGSLGEIVAGRRGHPFVLAFWSTQCAICIAEMAVWREVRAEVPEFDLILVATDSMVAAAQVEVILRRQEMAGFEAWIFDDPIPARLRADVDANWRGELPRIHFYDAEGNIEAHMGKVSKETVLAWLTGG